MLNTETFPPQRPQHLILRYEETLTHIPSKVSASHSSHIALTALTKSFGVLQCSSNSPAQGCEEPRIIYFDTWKFAQASLRAWCSIYPTFLLPPRLGWICLRTVYLPVCGNLQGGRRLEDAARPFKSGPKVLMWNALLRGVIKFHYSSKDSENIRFKRHQNTTFLHVLFWFSSGLSLAPMNTSLLVIRGLVEMTSSKNHNFWSL